jgi:hypothetical protein
MATGGGIGPRLGFRTGCGASPPTGALLGATGVVTVEQLSRGLRAGTARLWATALLSHRRETRGSHQQKAKDGKETNVHGSYGKGMWEQ